MEMKHYSNIFKWGPILLKACFSMGYPVNMEKTEEQKRPGTFENQSAHWSKQNSGHYLVFPLPCHLQRTYST